MFYQKATIYDFFVLAIHYYIHKFYINQSPFFCRASKRQFEIERLTVQIE